MTTTMKKKLPDGSAGSEAGFAVGTGSGKSASAKFDSKIDRLTYAIGDVHGCYEAFCHLLSEIKKDARAVGEKPRVILLGDYIDRGPHSREVLERIIDLSREEWCDLEVLIGNHEMIMLNFLLDPLYGPSWVEYGGGATLLSYGLQPPKSRTSNEDWEEIRQAFSKVVPASHLKLLTEASLKFQAGDYLFVHAGVKPGTPLADQGAETLLWIRKEFLVATKACEYVVVHGHTPTEEAVNQTWRIGVDTGAYATGMLSCVRLNNTSRKIISAS
jgi:serine/threonine protein phosphatase 1